MADRPAGPIDVALRCDLPVGVVRWTGPEPWATVVVKASFTLTGQVAWLAPEQAPLTGDRPSLLTPEELSLASDFAPYKPRADVLLVGAAHAGDMVWAIPAAFAVGALRRELFAVASAPSMAIPLSEVYLRSGPAPDAAVVRVGPRSPRSLGRAALAGVDWSFYNAAPPEQQVEALAVDTVIELSGLLRGAPLCRVALPGMRPRVHLVDQAGRNRIVGPVALRCDTLVIDTDTATCSLTWRGIFDLGGVARPCLLVGFDPAGTEPNEAELRDDLSRAAWTVATEPPSDDVEEPAPPAPPSRTAPVRLGAFRLGAPPPQAPEEPAVFVAPPAPVVVAAPPPVMVAAPVYAPPPAFVPEAYLAPLAAPAPVVLAAPEPPEEPRGHGLSLATFAAVQAAIWARRVPLAEALAAHGLDELGYLAAVPALLEGLAAEARQGRADRLLDLSARLRRAQEAP
jgi:hypothetical protein